jgi:hypothetical protein
MRRIAWVGLVVGAILAGACGGKGDEHHYPCGGGHDCGCTWCDGGPQFDVKHQEDAPRCGNQVCDPGEDCLTCAADCGHCSDVIPPERRIDWAPGIPGGIPDRTTVCARVTEPPYGAKGDGTTDDTAAIQAALDACPDDQVVEIPAGTYHVTGVLTIPRSITVRGAGPGQTVIDAFGTTWDGVLKFGPGGSPDYWYADNFATNVTGGATKGSWSITLADVSHVTVGDYLMIDQQNDPAFVTIHGYEGDCTYCSRENGNRAMGQNVEVTAVDTATGTVTFLPALYWTYDPALAPQAVPWPMGLKWAGAEDLTVRCNNTGYRTNFMMAACAYCWLRNVEGDYTDGDQVDIIASFQCEVRDSTFHDSFNKGPGQTDNDVFLADKTTATLVENNVIRRLHTGIMFDWGSAGNVVAYNFLESFWGDQVPNCSFGSLSNHGAHPMMNLYEGNVATKFAADGIHGGSSHGTLFRNWWAGSDLACEPMTGPRGPLDPARCWTMWQQVRAIDLDFGSVYHNVVGNILGSTYFQSPHCFPYYVDPSGGCENSAAGEYMTVATHAADVYTTPYVFRLGYAGAGPNAAFESDAPAMTLLNHGNWDFVTQTQKWDPSLGPSNLPPSLFRACKPGWFGDRPWPPIEPGGANPAAIELTIIPAGYRFAYGTAPPGATDEQCQ